MEVKEIAVTKLNPQPGDLFVIRTDRHLSQKACERIKRMFFDFLGVPDVRVAVLEKGLDLQLIRREDVQMTNEAVLRFEEEAVAQPPPETV